MLTTVTGYVLAGGRSSRMGTDKAMLQLGGKPLVAHAVSKLRAVTDEVFILGDRKELSSFAPLVSDLHPDAGPLGGIEAALAHNQRDWTIVIPVDVPFLPTAILKRWIAAVIQRPSSRVSILAADGRAHPAFCLLRKETSPMIGRSVKEGQLKLELAFESAAAELARTKSVSLEEVFAVQDTDRLCDAGDGDLTAEQLDSRSLWFTNLNTSEEFASASEHITLLEK